ncbi:metal-dependent hydrolase [Paraurantiacibacter namhicola]|uniref:Putative metal-dependent hydrolase n=1 Tax=Paraurantiacibacter namhicola TaxID=645517 RepID=A0A1C7DAB0_9SPHN|nr:metal-dependent hydrolase [Paraurantiacibacter namhicola]ANU08365.1 putative metal-dependent hydrolase [Paraurantiacibacter namhicola]
MNAPFPQPVKRGESRGKAAPTPADLTLNVRDRRFGRGSEQARWWLNGDPIATAWFNSLSACFPRGEGLFIDAVRHFREGTPPKLEAEIRAFIKQEVNHTREHVAFNRAATDAGYDTSRIEARVEHQIGLSKSRPPIAWLATTIALEHFTAMFAHEFLRHPRHFTNADVEQAELWKWHAAEEIEHKGVAYDTWLHATRDWSRFKRWSVKARVMAIVTFMFVRNRTVDALDLLEQDGITGLRARWRLWKYLLVKPGILRRMAGPWVSYFLPGFHPWQHDDRDLIAKYDSEFEAANL